MWWDDDLFHLQISAIQLDHAHTSKLNFDLSIVGIDIPDSSSIKLY